MDPSNKRRLLRSYLIDNIRCVKFVLHLASSLIPERIVRGFIAIVHGILEYICKHHEKGRKHWNITLHICSQYFECIQRSSALNKLASSSLRWASSSSLLSWLRANLVWQFKSIGTNEERGDLGGTVKKMSSSWTTPSPSQRPIEPPKEASTLKLDWFVILWVFTSARLKGV